jgi:hypothetical protein
MNDTVANDVEGSHRSALLDDPFAGSCFANGEKVAKGGELLVVEVPQENDCTERIGLHGQGP